MEPQSLPLLRTFLAAGQGLSEVNAQGESATHVALRLGDPELLKTLHEADVPLIPKLDGGRTYLHEAVVQGQLRLAKFILRDPGAFGLTRNSKDSRGKTPLHWAVLNSNSEMVALLLKYNADPSLPDRDGLNAIVYAQRLQTSNKQEIMEMLSAQDLLHRPEAPLDVLDQPESSKSSPGSKSTGKTAATEPNESEGLDALNRAVQASGIPIIQGADLTFGEVINRGSSCLVIKGKWRGTDVAIKQFRIEYRNSAKEMGKFVKELKVLASVRHPNLLMLMGLCIDQPNLCLVTEYVPNCTLFFALHKNKSRRLTLEDRYSFAIQLARGLVYLHSNDPPIVHRDLKPENCLVRSKQLDHAFNLKIADFGLARPLSCFSGETEAQTTTCIGTTRFMAPELFEREASVALGTEVDVWALGCMLIELFSNKRPWDYISSSNANCVYYEIFRKKPVPVPDVIPIGVKKVIKSCCQYDPSQRISVREVLAELEAQRSELF